MFQTVLRTVLSKRPICPRGMVPDPAASRLAHPMVLRSAAGCSPDASLLLVGDPTKEELVVPVGGANSLEPKELKAALLAEVEDLFGLCHFEGVTANPVDKIMPMT